MLDIGTSLKGRPRPAPFPIRISCTNGACNKHWFPLKEIRGKTLFNKDTAKFGFFFHVYHYRLHRTQELDLAKSTPMAAKAGDSFLELAGLLCLKGRYFLFGNAS